MLYFNDVVDIIEKKLIEENYKDFPINTNLTLKIASALYYLNEDLNILSNMKNDRKLYYWVFRSDELLDDLSFDPEVVFETRFKNESDVNEIYETVKDYINNSLEIYTDGLLFQQYHDDFVEDKLNNIELYKDISFEEYIHNLLNEFEYEFAGTSQFKENLGEYDGFYDEENDFLIGNDLIYVRRKLFNK